MMMLRISILALFLSVLNACGGSSGSGSCDDVLTVDYIQTEFATGFPGFTESGSAIVHTDGNQGNTYDIDKVAISRTTYNSNDSLAFSYTIYGTAQPPNGTYIAFFLDGDKNATTGAPIGTMGADALVINTAGGDANGYYLWGESSWIKQSILGTYSSNASYYQGCTYSTTIYAPLYNGLSSLYSTSVTGVVMVLTLNGADPTDVTSILDTSSQFDFVVP